MEIPCKFLLITLLFGTVVSSLNSRQCLSLKSRCKCQPYKTCDWSENLVNQIAVLPKDHINYRPFINFFRERICDTKTRDVYCCNDDWPKDTEVKNLKDCDSKKIISTTTKTTTAPKRVELRQDDTFKKCSGVDCGTWKPDPWKGECGTPTILNNILGGAITKLGEFPYVALLGYKSGRQTKYLCAGTLINKWYLLTTASCVSGQKEPEEVILGDYVIGSNPDCTRNTCAPRTVARKVGKIIIHGQYSQSDKKNDIALIRLEESIPLHNENPTVSIASPVCLPWLEDDAGRFIETNSRTIIAGFGQVTNRNLTNLRGLSKKQKFMRKTKLNLCEDFSNTQLCGTGSRGGSNGDLGGALVFREFSDDPWYQVGILSSFTGKFDEKKPGVYTKVEPFLPWIESKLEP